MSVSQHITHIPLLWHATGLILVTLLITINRFARSRHIILVCLTQLPGVVLHELSHLAAGLIFRASPYDFNLLPERSSKGWILGSVKFGRVTAFNAVPIALAPLGLVPLAYYVYLQWFGWFSPTLPNTLELYALIFVLIYNSLPSRQDMRIACNWKSVILYGSISGILGYFSPYR